MEVRGRRVSKRRSVIEREAAFPRRPPHFFVSDIRYELRRVSGRVTYLDEGIWSGGLASARVPLCRGLGPGWFTERFHRNALVTHFQHGQVFCAARRLENYAVARCRLHQCAPQRRHPTDVVAVEIDLVGAHDADHSLRSRAIGIAHGRSEECPRRRLPRSRSFRVHYFRGFDSLREKANPPIDLPQPPLAVLIVGVVTAIAVTSSPRHHLRHGAAFPGEQKPVFIFETL